MKHALIFLSTFVFSFYAVLGSSAALQAQDRSSRRQGPRQRPAERAPVIKPYDEVITKEAKSDEGVFTVHKIKEKVYYEIPKSELGKDFLWVSRIAKTTLGVGYGGQRAGNRVVRWERHGDRVLLRNVSYDVVADAKLPVARAVAAANNDIIIKAFNIEALGPNDAPVIEVTKLFTTEVPEFSARNRLRSRGFDTSRSFVERLASFPENIEVDATQTYTLPPSTQNPRGRRAPTPPRSPFRQTGMRPGSATVVMHYSMVKLPEKPMMPRLMDRRVGYFSVRQMDYGRDEQRAPRRTYITRYRLEKKDPQAALSEPIKPIVYYIDPATPAKWAPWLKRGIEDWQVAFEAAGFKNAIIAKDAPTPEEDPDWSPEDARYSVIRWLPSTIENASGPHVHDPRTGEILEADIQFYHNVMNLARDWYFVQVSPLDPRARKLPLPDELMGRLIEYVVAHEVGHTLGFQHNMKASSLYPADKVRDPAWVKKMGHTPTLMDYSRFNYVAQPEDKIDPADLIPKIGPYDKWATMWGYKPIAGANSPDEELKTLDEWARQQDKTPWLRFTTPETRGSDPGALTEAVGDADAVKSTALGLKNLKRVARHLLAATSQPGKPYDDLKEVYGRLLGQWSLEMGHVAAIVGGVDSQEKYAGQKGVIFTPIPREKQLEAVKFLNTYSFATPSFLIQPKILRRIEAAGVLSLIKSSQRRVLNSLLNSARILRLVEQEALDGESAYRPTDFLADVRGGIWSEIDKAPVKIDAYRRNLQRTYLEIMNEKLNGRNNSSLTDDTRPFVRGELRTLRASVVKALAWAADRATELHLRDVDDQIARMLDPKFIPPAPANPASPFRRRAWEEGPGWTISTQSCWPDYAVRLPDDH